MSIVSFVGPQGAGMTMAAVAPVYEELVVSGKEVVVGGHLLNRLGLGHELFSLKQLLDYMELEKG